MTPLHVFMLVGIFLTALGSLAISLAISREPYRTRWRLLQAALQQWLNEEV